MHNSFIGFNVRSAGEVPETENETLHSTNPQSDTVRLEKEGDTVPLEKEGDIVQLEREGDTVPLEKEGDIVQLEKEGDTVQLEREGDTVRLEKEGDTQHSIVLSSGETSVSLEHSTTLPNKGASASVKTNQKNLSSDARSKAVESEGQL